MYVHRGANRAIRSKAASWAASYANPEVADEVLRVDATRWARSMVDEVFDIAIERPLAPAIALSSFAMSAMLVGTAWWAHRQGEGHFGAVVFFGVVLLAVMIVLQVIMKPQSSRKLRAELGYRLNAQAIGGVRRRRAFATPKPVALDGDYTWKDVERLALRWMHYLGATDMVLTKDRADQGIDGISPVFVLQVKNWRRDRVGVDKIRELYGVAQKMRRRPIFFTASGYTPDALAFAREVAMPLLVFSADKGSLVGANPEGAFLRRNGVHGAMPQPIAVDTGP